LRGQGLNQTINNFPGNAAVFVPADAEWTIEGQFLDAWSVVVR
jgi:hypothetical protein